VLYEMSNNSKTVFLHFLFFLPENKNRVISIAFLRQKLEVWEKIDEKKTKTLNSYENLKN
jgi:hypothetical protein